MLIVHICAQCAIVDYTACTLNISLYKHNTCILELLCGIARHFFTYYYYYYYYIVCIRIKALRADNARALPAKPVFGWRLRDINLEPVEGCGLRVF